MICLGQSVRLTPLSLYQSEWKKKMAHESCLLLWQTNAQTSVAALKIYVAPIKGWVNSWLFHYMVTQRQGPSLLWLHHLIGLQICMHSPQMGQERVDNTTHTYFLKFSGGITFLPTCKREIYVVAELAATIQWLLYTMEMDIGLFLPWVVISMVSVKNIASILR